MTNQQPPDIIEVFGVKYQRVEEPKPPTLYDTIFSDCPMGRQDVCVAVEKWLLKIDNIDIQPPLYADGWKDCIKYLKKNLK